MRHNRCEVITELVNQRCRVGKNAFSGFLADCARHSDRPQVIRVRNKYTGRIRWKGGASMKSKEVTVPELALIAGTRGMLGAGIGLLLSGKLSREQRRAVGWTLVAVGALTTIPLVVEVFGNGK